MTKAIGSIIVRQAAKDGEQGISVTNVVRYYLATSAGSGVTTSTAGWTTTPQSPTVTNKYLWTYDKTYFSNSTTSVTTPSITGVYGDTGVTGLSVRQTEWAEGFEYRNDSNLTTSPRYLDIVAVLSTSGLYTDAAGQKYTLYQAKEAHNGVTSAASNKPGSGASWQTYWDQLNQLKPIYTPLLLAQLIKAQQIDVDNLTVKHVNAINGAGDTSCSIDGSTGKLAAKKAEISGSMRTPWITLSYVLLYSSSGVDVYGYNGNAVDLDKVRLIGVGGELVLAWGTNADGREIAVRVENFSGNSHIKVPSGYNLIDDSGTSHSGGSSYSLLNNKIYYLTGCSDIWVIKKISSI